MNQSIKNKLRCLFTLLMLLPGIAWADNVAKIGETGYETLKAAVAAADDGATINLLADDNSLSDGSEIEINKSLTITGEVAANGEPLYTIYGKSDQTGHNDIFITGSGTVTLSNLKIKNFGNNVNTDTGHAPIYVSTNFTGTVKLTNVYVSDFNRGGIFLYGGGTFNVDECYIDCANARSDAFTKGIEIKGSASGTISNTLICNMERSSTTYSTAGIEIYGSGSITVDKCTIISDNDDHSAVKGTYGIVSQRVGEHDPSGGSLQVTETMMSCTNACLSVADNDQYGPVNNYSITVDDCDFDNYIATWSATSSITINSGSYAEDVYADAGTIIIHGGEFTNFAPYTGTNGSIVIDGGTFDASVPEQYCADGFICPSAPNEAGMYVITEGSYVAMIGEVKYETLEAAFAAAADGATITLLADCTGNGIKVPQGKYSTGLTVDFGGHTYTVDGTTVGSSGTETNGFQLLKDNTITFQNGTITSEKAKILIQNYSNLTLEGMTLTLDNANYSSAYTLSNNNGNVVIDGTTINVNPAGGFAFDVCRYASYPSVSVEVKGESYINGNVEISASGSDAKDGFGLTLTDGTITGDIVMDATAAAAMAATPEKVSITKSEAFEQDAPEGYKWVDADGTSTLAACEYVAQIDNAKYETLAEAIDAVPTDGTATTITMIADEAIVAGVTIAVGKNIVLELNGKTVSGNTDSGKTYALITNQGTLTIQDNSDTGKDGTGAGLITTYISNPDGGDVPGYASNTITNNGTLTVKSGKIVNNGSGYACYAIDNQTNGSTYTPVLNIEGGRMQQMNAYTYAVRMFCNSQTNTNTVNVSGGVIEGGYGLWLQTPNNNSNMASLNITGGTFNANDGAALYIGGTKADNSKITIDISGGTINGTGVIIQGPLSGTYGSVSISDGNIVNVQCGANVEHFISGGTYGNPVNEAFCAEGFIPTELENGLYGVKEGAYVAQYGDKKYESLQEALDAAEATQSVVLLQDIDLGDESLSISKALTIDGGGQYGITSSAAQAVLLTGEGAATFKDVAIVASAGHGIQAGNDDAAYSGQLTLNGATLTVAKRGVRVYKENTGFGIAVDGSVIQSNVADPTTTYTTGNDAMALSLGATDGKGYTVTVNNSELKGFSYDINSVTSGSNLTVTMTGGKTYGRAALNVWGSNNTFTLDGVEVHGLNNQTGPTEAFACIVENEGATGNTYNINGVTFIANLSEAAINTEGSSATQQMVDLRGTGATMKITGNTTYTCNSEERGGLFYNEGALETSTVLLDATAKGNLEQLIKKAMVASEPNENELYAVTYVSEVYYYWIAEGVEEGENCDFADPFVNGWLCDGEFIRLKKDVTLTADIECQLASGTFTLTQGDYSITKGDYAVTLKAGVSVVTNKETDIFVAADAENYYVAMTEQEGTFTYAVTEKPDVAMIGETGYKTLAAAIAAVPTDGTATTITMVANEIISVSGYALTVSANQNVVLDLNGHQVVGTCETSGTSALIRNLGTLTIQDSSDTNADGTGDGKLIAGASSTWTWDGTDDYAGSYASNLIRNEGTLFVNSGFLNNISTGSAAYAIDNYSAGNVTINGGKLDAAKASAIRMFYVDGGSLTVAGGTVGHYNSDDDCSYMGIQVMSGSNVNVSVTGGSIAGQYALYANNTGGSIKISDGAFDGYVGFGSAGPNDISITGGTFDCWVGTWGSQTGFIHGGQFSDRVETAYLAEGFVCSDEPNSDGYYTVKEVGDVNRDGDVNYADVEAIVKIILGTTTEEDNFDMGAANVDGDADGKITISDVTALIKILTENTTTEEDTPSEESGE